MSNWCSATGFSTNCVKLSNESGRIGSRLSALEMFITATGFEVLPVGAPGVVMRDAADQPILDAAIAGAVDVIVTGDKDFLALAIDRPLILTAREYVDSVEAG